jgi:hypothetical protein
VDYHVTSVLGLYVETMVTVYGEYAAGIFVFGDNGTGNRALVLPTIHAC